MAGPWDYVSMPAAPAAPSYAAPLVNFAPLGDLAKDYYAGQQAQRQIAIQQAFKSGLPTNPQTGQTDYSAAAQKLFQLGAYQEGVNLLHAGTEAGVLQQPTRDDSDLYGGSRQPSVSAPTTPQTSVRSPVTSDTAPTAPRTPEGSTRNLTGDDTTTIAGPPQPIPAGMSTAQAVQNLQRTGQVTPGQPQPDASVQPQPAPIGDPNAPIVPRAVPTVRTSQFVQPPQAAPAQSTVADTILPPGYRGRPLDFIADATKRGNTYLQEANRREAVGIKSDALREQGTRLLDVAKQVRDVIAPTTDQRDAITSGYPNVAEYKSGIEQRTAENKAGAALYNGLQGSSRAFDEMRPHLDAMRGLFNDPNFYSGTASQLNLAYKKALASMGGDPNTALPQEALRKVVAANILNQTDQLKAEAAQMGGQSGRIFLQQVELMRQAAQNPDSTPAALRYLTELGYRQGEHANAVADLASTYKNGRLDNGFNPILRKYNSDHPLFSDAEMKDIRLVAPPVFGTPQQAYGAGLKKGDPVRTPPRPGYPRGQVGYLQ